MSILPDESADYSVLSSSNIVLGDREITPIYEATLGYKRTSGVFGFKTYLGPLDTEPISEFDSSLELIMNFGWAIIKPFSKASVEIYSADASVDSLRNYLNKEIDFRNLVINLLTEESFRFFIQRLDLVIEIERFPHLDVNINVPWPLI